MFLDLVGLYLKSGLNLEDNSIYSIQIFDAVSYMFRYMIIMKLFFKKIFVKLWRMLQNFKKSFEECLLLH